MEKAPQFIQARKENFAYLKNRLKSCEEFLQLPEATEHSYPLWFGFPITVKANSLVTRLDLLTSSFNDYILQSITSVSENEPIRRELLALMRSGDVGALESVIKRLFASIAYNNYTNNDIAR